VAGSFTSNKKREQKLPLLSKLPTLYQISEWDRDNPDKVERILATEKELLEA